VPTVREHVTEESSKVSSLVHKFTHSGIDSSMVQSTRGDMTPGTSVLVLLTPEARSLPSQRRSGEQGVELIRSEGPVTGRCEAYSLRLSSHAQPTSRSTASTARKPAAP
jgi:hypothetical protein